jgi:hypothetical protein
MSLGSKSLPPPTAEQKRRWELIRAKGCIIARSEGMGFVPCEIHHLKSGNVRMGHDFTIGLSAWIHRKSVLSPKRHYGVSLMDGSAAFHRAYGSDDRLLKYQNADFKFRNFQRVKIEGIEAVGFVFSRLANADEQNEYKVKYWMEGKRAEEWFYEFELEAA